MPLSNGAMAMSSRGTRARAFLLNLMALCTSNQDQRKTI